MTKRLSRLRNLVDHAHDVLFEAVEKVRADHRKELVTGLHARVVLHRQAGSVEVTIDGRLPSARTAIEEAAHKAAWTLFSGEGGGFSATLKPAREVPNAGWCCTVKLPPVKTDEDMLAPGDELRRLVERRQSYLEKARDVATLVLKKAGAEVETFSTG